MSDGPSILQMLEAFAADFGLKAGARAQQAITDIEAEKYTFERLVSDMFGAPNDAFQSLLYVCNATKDPPPAKPDKLTMNISLGDPDPKSYQLSFPVAAATALTCDDLMSVVPSGGQMAPKIPKSMIAVSVPQANQIVVTLTGWHAVAQVGKYQGRIRKAGAELRLLTLNVT